MYFTALPDHSDPAFDEAAHFDAFRRHNIIFNAEVRRSACAEHVGCFSLKTVFSGEEWYGVNGVPLRVRQGQFLLLNDEQTYSSRIDSDRPVQSCSLFFQRDFVRRITAGVRRSEEALMDDPLGEASAPEFHQHLYALNEGLQRRLGRLLNALDLAGHSTFLADEHLAGILQHLIAGQRGERLRSELLPAVKAGTRAEISRRLHVARDVLHSLYDRPAIDLDTLSRYALLSVPQLIRQFRILFGETPHQYLTRIRLQAAADLLRTTALDVQGITLSVGLSDASAFCRLFRLRYGCTPLAYRKDHLRN